MFPSTLGNKNGSVFIFPVQSCVHYIIITEPFEPGLPNESNGLHCIVFNALLLVKPETT